MYELVEFGKSPVEVQDFRNITGCFIVTCWTTWNHRARAKQHVHWFLGGKVLGTQQRTSVWVGSPKSNYRSDLQTLGILTDYAAKKKENKKVSLDIQCSLLSWSFCELWTREGLVGGLYPLTPKVLQPSQSFWSQASWGSLMAKIFFVMVHHIRLLVVNSIQPKRMMKVWGNVATFLATILSIYPLGWGGGQNPHTHLWWKFFHALLWSFCSLENSS